MGKRIYRAPILQLAPDQIWVFGSNTEGRHGKGAALIAMKQYGAEYGNPRGRQGQSYAIITKNLRKKIHPSISQDFITLQISQLYDYARLYPELEFFIIYNGKGNNLNNYSPLEMALMFRLENIPDNIVFEEEFDKLVYNN